MSRANWADSIKRELRDALDHVLAIKCSCEERRCHRCEAGLTLAAALGYQSPQAHSIVSGETTVTRLELSRLRIEYAQALKDEMAARYPGARVSKVSVFESVAGGRSGMVASDEGRGTEYPPAARK